MQLHCKQIVFRYIALLLLVTLTVHAKEVPIMKTVTINIPKGEYSILDFPFEIKEIQMKAFKYKKLVTKKIEITENTNVEEKVTLNKKGDIPTKQTTGNTLGIEKGKNVISFRPQIFGTTEMIIWGYKNFPLIIKIEVVEPEEADKYIKFVETIDNKKDVIKFESSAHEKIIENIVKHLYDENYESKPAGYESIVRNTSYFVEVKNKEKEVIGHLKNSLIREIIGRDYLGQVWNINFVSNEKNQEKTIINLYEEMFDEDGIYGVSLESYSINENNGTRVMVVRRR